MATLLFTENFFKEGKIERMKEREKESTKFKSAHLWLLLIIIQLTYTRIGFVYLI